MALDITYEKNLIINNRELVYKGIYKVDELFSQINSSLEEKGYEKREKKTEEIVTEEGKRTFIELRPLKEKTHYVTLMIKIKITLDNTVSLVEEKTGLKQKFEQGDVHIAFDAWSLTEYEHRWMMKPWVFFFKSVINKYVYTFPLEAGTTGELVADTAYIYAQIKNLLNSYTAKENKLVNEEDVRREIAEDVAKSGRKM